LLWSDPVDSVEGLCDPEYKPNDVRGCSYFFGVKAVSNFFDKTKFISLIRAHEAQLDGFKMHKWKGETTFPPVITIFSAPNYCDVYNNKGAIIKFAVYNKSEQHPKYSTIQLQQSPIHAS